MIRDKDASTFTTPIICSQPLDRPHTPAYQHSPAGTKAVFILHCHPILRVWDEACFICMCIKMSEDLVFVCQCLL